MTIEEALKHINRTFKYKGDKKWFDKWTIMNEPFVGDCEDYSLTAIYYANDKSMMKFLLTLMTFQYIVYYVKTSRGEGHAITRHKGMYFDNIQRKLVTKEKLVEDGYKLFIPLPFPFVFLKMFIGTAMK